MPGLTDSFLELLSKIGDSDLSVFIDSLGYSDNKEIVETSLSIDHISWKFTFVNNDKDRIRAEELFLPGFRKAVMIKINHKGTPKKGTTFKEYERIAASQIRKPELEPWKLMERRIRSTFHTWMTGSGLTKAIAKHHRNNFKQTIERQLFPTGFTRQELLTIVGEVYDENLVKEVIES